MDIIDVLFARALSGGGGASPVLIDKNITENGTYNAADDGADGYKKAVVNVAQQNILFDSGEESHMFFVSAKNIEKVTVPEGFTTLYKTNSMSSLMAATHMKECILPSTLTKIDYNMFSLCTALEKITINKPEGSITGAPWGAPASCEVIWNG